MNGKQVSILLLVTTTSNASSNTTTFACHLTLSSGWRSSLGCGGGSIAITVIIVLELVLTTSVILVWWGHQCCHRIGVMGPRWCWCWWGCGVGVIVAKLVLLVLSSLSSCWCWCQGPSLLLHCIRKVTRVYVCLMQSVPDGQTCQTMWTSDLIA